MADLLIAVLAFVALAVVLVVLFRSETLGRTYLAAGLVLLTLAAATAGVLIYRAGDSPSSSAAAPTPASSPSTQAGLGAAVVQVEVPLGRGDKYPQGAIFLDPPRAGTDAYTGDISLLCSTPGKDDTVQNCTGVDERVWSAEPLDDRAVLARAAGDPFAGPEACDTANGVSFQSQYMELEEGRSYCMRKTGDAQQVVAFRIPTFPATTPLPTELLIDVTVWAI
ncbi:hypothetical protein [Actinoplanes sp. NPDC051851]|uniref:hypothetical protein n=1 Tax=Actinoplanes sp. NPDC051851 TaxID=3154753 RepID=UPI00343D0226